MSIWFETALELIIRFVANYAFVPLLLELPLKIQYAFVWNENVANQRNTLQSIQMIQSNFEHVHQFVLSGSHFFLHILIHYIVNPCLLFSTPFYLFVHLCVCAKFTLRLDKTRRPTRREKEKKIESSKCQNPLYRKIMS